MIDSFLSATPELLTCIFRSCDGLPQILSLAKLYNEPFFKAKEDGHDGFLGRCEDVLRAEAAGSWTLGDMSDEDVLFLRQFAVNNFDMVDHCPTGKWRNDYYEAVFGPFASWLIGDGRSRARQENVGSSSDEQDEDEEPGDGKKRAIQ
ncbi:uncharacterized protein LY89DRAFT_742783 [Mollisia scopiformis]|uniref:Uncharacterized protein n=1 Tax=Mollisia scopiformis TaxID=149040 RepID=A0A132B569_MOLSC|nr:uncharacterized protein LY89DRAFT_742783 [Mollisia scopiformis]KUJ07555.1 hypothetical protein LY89DRAFT_742783 [Mollisia scopiformis]